MDVKLKLSLSSKKHFLSQDIVRTYSGVEVPNIKCIT